MSSGVLTVDRRLPNPAEVRRVLGSTDETWCAGHGTPQSLVRLLYPVFRVQYTYTIEGSFPWSSTETEHDAFLVDGLQAGTTRNLGECLESAFDPATVYPAGRDGDEAVQTQLLEFQTTDSAVSGTLTEQLADRGVDPTPETLPSSVPTDLAVFEREDRVFNAVESVSRLYLPFWLVKLGSDEYDYPCYLAVRDVGASGGAPVETHPWLATFATEHPELLTEYRREGWLGSPQETGSATAVEHQDRDPVEPEDSTVSVDEVLDPNPGRSFDDVAGMAALKQQLEHRVVGPYRDPGAFADYGLGTVDGVLLYGPPGCGKTYVAGALAGELGYHFLPVSRQTPPASGCASRHRTSRTCSQSRGRTNPVWSSWTRLTRSPTSGTAG